MAAPETTPREPTGERDTCPRCGRRTVRRRDGLFVWRACPASRSCGWDVFAEPFPDRREPADDRDRSTVGPAV